MLILINLYAVNCNKPIVRKPIHPVHSNKYVYPADVCRPVCPVDIYKPVCSVNIRTSFFVEFLRHLILFFILSFIF